MPWRPPRKRGPGADRGRECGKPSRAWRFRRPTHAGGRASGGDGPVYNPDVSGAVEFWHFWASPVRQNAIRRVIAMCQQKLPKITVIDAVKPFGDIWTANLAAVAAGAGMPDVIVSDRPHLPQDAADGVFMSLQEWADRDNVNRDQFYNWAWDQAVYDGEVYGIPHETDVNVLFYNKNLFQQAGLDPDKPPATWAELEGTRTGWTDRDGEIERIAFFPLWNRGRDVWQYINSADMIRPDGTPQINNPKMVETVEWMKKWVDRYGGWERAAGLPQPVRSAAERSLHVVGRCRNVRRHLRLQQPAPVLPADGEARQRRRRRGSTGASRCCPTIRSRARRAAASPCRFPTGAAEPRGGLGVH